MSDFVQELELNNWFQMFQRLVVIIDGISLNIFRQQHVPTFQKALAFVISSALKARKFVPPAHVGALTGAIYNINCNYDAVVNTDLKVTTGFCKQCSCLFYINNILKVVNALHTCSRPS